MRIRSQSRPHRTQPMEKLQAQLCLKVTIASSRTAFIAYWSGIKRERLSLLLPLNRIRTKILMSTHPMEVITLRTSQTYLSNTQWSRHKARRSNTRWGHNRWMCSGVRWQSMILRIVVNNLLKLRSSLKGHFSGLKGLSQRCFRHTRLTKSRSQHHRIKRKYIANELVSEEGWSSIKYKQMVQQCLQALVVPQIRDRVASKTLLQ